jgi:nucleotide-binding universal stress UspA family protein
VVVEGARGGSIGAMPMTVLLCVDGSELCAEALAAGLAVLAPADRTVLATVVEPADASLVVGAGLAGGVMPAGEAQRLHDSQLAAAQGALDETATALGLTGAEKTVVAGAPGPALRDLAESLPASVVVMGTRGHGGLRRAVLGSVSDHVIRHAHCPVLTYGPG